MSDILILALIFAGSILASFAATVLLEKKFIPYLMRIKMGQKILEIGPRWHKNKEGTPTMGGIFFIGGIIVSLVLFASVSIVKTGDLKTLCVLGFMLANGAIGFADDYVKFVKKRNKGLSAPQKLVFQFAAAILFLAAMRACGGITSTALPLPFSDSSVELGIFYWILAVLFIAFTVNSTNLTDGIDGLCGSVTLVISVFFAVVLFKFAIPDPSASTARLTLVGGLIGGLVGFLFYNVHPARIFMGDTGSLFIGGAVTGLAFLVDEPLIIAIAGFIYFVESFSVVLQVLSFKLTGKRIFKMSPIHHHFELCGWSENRIVVVFTAVTALLCAASFWGVG
ncbi:MAG: phospho-N-acetylmuramoyl-pentapeptide-transferase [Clostridia bacterium]|nr:phospho-N-acetylmuramoyl-pentapeptide-transferase [Clostridia bacterium]